jgi:septal ring factor EnvC (AmiA/AmiB activator)
VNWPELLGAIFASSAAAALLTGLFNRRKVAAEARALDGEALNKAAQGYAALIAALTQQQNETTRQVAELMTRLTEAEREIHSLREENTHLRQEITRLQALLVKVGVDPHTGECVERRLNL